MRFLPGLRDARQSVEAPFLAPLAQRSLSIGPLSARRLFAAADRHECWRVRISDGLLRGGGGGLPSVQRAVQGKLRRRGIYSCAQDLSSEHEDADILRKMEECRLNRDIARMEALLALFRLANPNRHNPRIYSTALRCYLQASHPQLALDFFRSMVTQGWKPVLPDLEALMYGLLKHSDREGASHVMESLAKHGLKPRTATFNLWIRHHLRDQQPEKARAVFRELERARLHPNQSTFLDFIAYFINKSDYSAAEKIKEYIRAKRVPVDIRFYNGLLDCLVRRGAFEEVGAVLGEMRERGLVHNLHTYNTLIEGYASTNHHEKVDALMTEMQSRGILPTTETFNKLLTSYSHAMAPEQSKQILLQMSRLGLIFNSYTYAALIQNLLRREKYREALEMIFEMGSKDVALTVESYGQLFKICCERRIDPAILPLWQQMQSNKVPPNNVIFSTLIRYYLMRRNYPRVDSLLLEMRRKWNLKPNPYIFSTLLNHYVENMDFVRMDGLLKIIRESDVEISSVMYNVLMKSFYSYSRYQQGGHISRFKGLHKDDLQDESIGLENVTPKFSVEEDNEPMDVPKLAAQFQKLFKLPFRPTVHIFNEMMLSYFVRERFAEMFNCINEMRKSEVIPNQLTFTLMVKARIFQGNIDGSRSLLLEMSKVGLRPTVLHCALLLHAFCRRLMTEAAESFLIEMEALHHIKPNHVFFGSLIFAYTRKREYSSVFKVFERMELAGFMPDTETCNYVLISLLEIGEFTEARRFFEKMLLQGIKRNTHTYAYLADSFIVRKEDSALLAILPDCLAPGNMIDAYPFNRLMGYYYEEGELDRLVSILTLMCDYCVRFDRDTLPYLSLAFQRHLRDADSLLVLRKVVQKALVDMEADLSGNLSRMLEQLRKAYSESGQMAVVAELDQFIAELPNLRLLWTKISPKAIATFESHFEKRPDAPILSHHQEYDTARTQIGEITAQSPSPLSGHFFDVIK